MGNALEPKAAHLAARRFHAPVALALVRDGDAMAAWLVNGLPEDASGRVRLAVESADGTTLHDTQARVKVRAGGGGEVARPAIADAMPLAHDVYVGAVFESDDVDCEPLEAISFLAEPRDPRMPPPILRATADDGATGR